jgi:prophage maintenance system killer protein
MRTKIRWGGKEIGSLGSVVGIHSEVAAMYTGTLIQDLMATVERAELRAEQRVEQKRLEEILELQAMFAMQIPVMEGEHVFMGAA